jgi:nucleoside transporter
MDFKTGYIRTRLSGMMFLQFFVWATWWVPIVPYAMLGRPFLTGYDAGWLAATVPLGAIFAPLLIGPLADRLFATERVLCVLHVVGGLSLFLAPQGESFWWLFAFLLIHTFCFMPTLALANSLTFRNIASANLFPRIALFGTIGWIISGWIVGVQLGGTNPAIFYLAGTAELLLAAYCLTLPHTPPKGEAKTVADMLGLKAVALLKDPAFLLFVVCAFLIVIPASLYFVGLNQMLTETDRPAPTALLTLSQISEMAVMFAMPWFIGAIGLRGTLAVGMAAWAIRYVLFATSLFPFIVLGLLLHGFAYVFVFVGAYIYVDKKAPPDLRASAQSFIAFVMLGLGMFLGTTLGGSVIESHPAYEGSMPATREVVLQEGDGVTEIEPLTPLERAPLPDWKVVAKRLDQDENGQIWLKELETISDPGFQVIDEMKVGAESTKKRIMTYARKDLVNTFTKIDDRKPIQTRGDFKTAKIGEISVERPDWLAAQVHHWPPMWLWFAFLAGVICLAFAVGTLFTSDEAVAAAPSETPMSPSRPVEPPSAAQAAEPMTTPPSPESEPPAA